MDCPKSPKTIIKPNRKMKKLHLFLCLLIAGITTGFAQTETIRFTTASDRSGRIYISTSDSAEIILSKNGITQTYTSDKSISFSISTGSTYTMYASKGKITGISSADLQTLNAYQCINLESLNLSNQSRDFKNPINSLQELNVTGCTGLNSLDCRGHNLTTLDVSTCTALEYLDCSEPVVGLAPDSTAGLPYTFMSNLKTLNIKGCSNLQTLHCWGNPIEEIDASDLLNLKTLDIASYHFCILKKLDVSGCIALEKLYCVGHRLKSLDLSNCISLLELNCANGKDELTDLNISGCKNIEKIDCSKNQISSDLDLSNCSKLKEVYCQNNQISNSFDLSNCENLIRLECQNNQIPNLNVDGCTNLRWLDCGDNRITSDLNIDSHIGVLRCENNQISNIKVNKGFQRFIDTIEGKAYYCYLICDNNSLKELDFSNCSELEILTCGNNQLSTLDLSSCPKLRAVWCENNRINNWDIDKCLELRVCMPTATPCRYPKAMLWRNLTKTISSLRVSTFGTALPISIYSGRLSRMAYSTCTRKWSLPAPPPK